MNINDYKNYYSQKKVLYRIARYLQNREGTFLSETKAIRCIKVNHSIYLEKNMQAFDFFTYPLNIYHSLAHFPALPMFSFNLKTRKIQQNEFNQTFRTFLTGYDMGLDFDSHIIDEKTKKIIDYPFKDMKNDVYRVKKDLDKYNVPYMIKTSGSGFHINIPSYALWSINLPCTMDIINRMTQNIKIIYNLKSLDLSSNNERKIWKCPYSYDIKTDRIAITLNDDEFDNFSYNDTKYDIVLDNWGDETQINDKIRNGTTKGAIEFKEMILND